MENFDENIFESEDLFEDTTDNESEESTEEPSEDTEPTEETQSEESGEPAESETIKFKHNHEATELDKKAVEIIAKPLGMDADELIKTLQKGKNYEKAIEKYTSDPAVAAISQISKMTGDTPDVIIEKFRQMTERAGIAQAVQEIKAAHPEYEDNVVMDLAKARYQMAQQQKQEEMRQREIQAQTQSLDPWVKFFQHFPDLTPESIPDAVLTGLDRGLTPIEAYLDYQLEHKNVEMESERKKSRGKRKEPRQHER